MVLFANTQEAFAMPAFAELARLHGAGAIRLIGVVCTRHAQPFSTRLRSQLRRLLSAKARGETIGAAASRLGVRVVVPASLDINDGEAATYLKTVGPDIVLIFGCDQILQAPLIASAALFVNYHNSLLPKYRGVGATIWPYLEGADESGFTYHTIGDERIDEGRVVFQAKLPMPPIAEANKYSALLNEAAARALPLVIDVLVRGERLEQLPGHGEYYSRKKLRHATVADPGLTVDEAYKRATIIGHLLLQYRWLVFRLQDPHKERSRWSDLPVAFADGVLWFSRVNYLPAVFSRPVVRLFCRR